MNGWNPFKGKCADEETLVPNRRARRDAQFQRGVKKPGRSRIRRGISGPAPKDKFEKFANLYAFFSGQR